MGEERSGGGGNVIIATAPPIMPKGLVAAISEIQQFYAIEKRGGRVDEDYFTLENTLTFFEVGFKAAFISGLVSALCSPLAIGVVEKVLPAFGDNEPTLYDKLFVFILAMGFPVGYAIFIGSVGKYYAGPFTKRMIRNLLGGSITGAVTKMILAVILFHWLYVQSTPGQASNALRFLSGWISDNALTSVYYLAMDFRPVLLTASWFVVVTTIVFVLIPVTSVAFNAYKNRNMFTER